MASNNIENKIKDYIKNIPIKGYKFDDDFQNDYLTEEIEDFVRDILDNEKNISKETKQALKLFNFYIKLHNAVIADYLTGRGNELSSFVGIQNPNSD